ncbi:MAG: Nif3-like dinuclear metal center hexameric protein [Rhodothermales bacterium]
MSATVSEIARVLEAWAPGGTAQSWDNVGLQVGRPDAEVTRAVIALDMTPHVLEEARAMHAELIVTHHPLLFRGIKRVTPDGLVPGLVLGLAEQGIALYSIHTNLDAARDGVSFELARRLGARDVTFLSGLEDAVRKLVTFVPPDDADAVHQALAAAGAGRIGHYEACAFRSDGTGQFRPGAQANPHTGTAGGPLESVPEIRLEMEVAAHRVSAVVAALRDAHPYEEVAYDLYPVQQPYRDAGLGAIGQLPESIPLGTFLDRVADALASPGLRYAGDPERMVQRVAVCGGSGSDFIPVAQRAGADVYVTADITYHTWFDVMAPDGSVAMALVDPGHYETERLTEDLLRDRLADAIPDVTWHVTGTRTAPVRTWLAGN